MRVQSGTSATLCKLRKGDTLDDEGDHRLAVESRTRHGQRDKKRGKAYRQIGKPRVSARKSAHRAPYWGETSGGVALRDRRVQNCTRRTCVRRATLHLHGHTFTTGAKRQPVNPSDVSTSWISPD